MSNIVGHIFGEDLNTIKFICDSVDKDGQIQRVDLGELLVIYDSISRDRFLIRVTNVGYGQNPMWSKENARGFNLIANENFTDEYENFENRFKQNQKHQLFLEASCELVGFIGEDNRFANPRRLPSYFSPVRRLDTHDIDFMENFLGDIYLGVLRSGSNYLGMPVGFHSDYIPYHIGVFAQTGGGKSNAVLRFTSGVLESDGKVAMLIFEPHGEYMQELLKHPYANQNMVVFSNSQTNNFRNLKISYSDLTVSHLLNLRKNLNLTEPQERFLFEVEERHGREWFKYLVETPVDEDEAQTMNGFHNSTLKDDFRNTYLDTIKVTKSKVNRIKKSAFLTRDSAVSDLNEVISLLLRGKVVLIDTSPLRDMEELLLSTVISSKLLKHQKKQYQNNRSDFENSPPVSIVIEEAQRVLSKESNVDGNVFAQICNEGRKFRTGLMAITQRPTAIDEKLLSQFNTLFILGISDEKHFEALRGVSKKPIDKLRNEIRALAPGEAIITSPKAPFALPVKIDLYSEHIKKLSVTEQQPKNSYFGSEMYNF